MLSGVVKSLVNKFLNEYVEGDFDVGVGLLFGKHALELDDVELKCAPLNELLLGQGVPLSLTRIKVARLELDIPFARLGSRPVRLMVDGVDVEAQVDLEEDWDEAKAKEEIVEAAKAFLVTVLEEMHPGESVSPLSRNPSLYFSSEGMLNRTITRIVDNLEISLSKVVVRLETPCIQVCKGVRLLSRQEGTDRLFHGGFPSTWATSAQERSVLELTVVSLTLVTTDENWERHFDDDCDYIVFKILCLEGVQVVLHPRILAGQVLEDPRPLVAPASLELRAKLNTAFSVGPGEPHRLDGQLKSSPLVIRFEVDDLAWLAELGAHFGRHGAWYDSVASRERRRNVAWLQDRMSRTGVEPFTEYLQLCCARARLLARKVDPKERQKQLKELAENEDLVQLERHLEQERAAQAIRTAADRAYRTKHFRLRSFESSVDQVDSAAWAGSQDRSHADSEPGDRHRRPGSTGGRSPSVGGQSSPAHGLSALEEAVVSSTGWQGPLAKSLEAELVGTSTSQGKLAAPKLAQDEIEITFGPGELGLTLDRGFNQDAAVVTGCIPGSQAARTRLIEAGMIVTAVRNYATADLSYEETLRRIEVGRRPMTIRFKGSESAAKAAAKIVKGSKVNFVRCVLAIDCIDFALSSTADQPIISSRVVGIAGGLNTLSAGAAVGILERLFHIVEVEASLGVLYLDILDPSSSKGPSHLVSSAPCSDVHGMGVNVEQPVAPRDEDICAEPFDMTWSPFHRIHDDAVSSLLADRRWMYHVFVASMLLWKPRRIHLEASPRKEGLVERQTFGELLNAMDSFERWNKASDSVWGRWSPQVVPTRDVGPLFEFNFRMRRWRSIFFGHILCRPAAVDLQLVIRIPDPLLDSDEPLSFKPVSPKLERTAGEVYQDSGGGDDSDHHHHHHHHHNNNKDGREMGSDHSDIGDVSDPESAVNDDKGGSRLWLLELELSGIIRTLEVCLQPELVPKLLDFASKLENSTKWLLGHDAPQQSDTLQVLKDGDPISWTRFRVDITIHPIALVLSPALVEVTKSVRMMEAATVSVGPIVFFSSEHVPAAAAEEARNLREPTSREDVVFCRVDSIRVAVTNKRGRNESVDGAPLAKSASSGEAKLGLARSTSVFHDPDSSDSDSQFHDAEQTPQEEDEEDGLSEMPSFRGSSPEHGRQPSFSAMENPQYVELLSMSVRLARLAFQGAPFSTFPLDLSLVLDSILINVTTSHVVALVDVLDVVTLVLGPVGPPAQSSGDGESQSQSMVDSDTAHAEVDSVDAELRCFMNSRTSQGAVEAMHVGLMQVCTRILGFDEPAPEKVTMTNLETAALACEIMEGVFDFVGPVLASHLTDKGLGASWFLDQTIANVIDHLLLYFYGAVWKERRAALSSSSGKRQSRRAKVKGAPRSPPRSPQVTSSKATKVNSVSSIAQLQQHRSTLQQEQLQKEREGVSAVFWSTVRLHVRVSTLVVKAFSRLELSLGTTQVEMVSSSIKDTNRLHLTVRECVLRNLETEEVVISRNEAAKEAQKHCLVVSVSLSSRDRVTGAQANRGRHGSAIWDNSFALDAESSSSSSSSSDESQSDMEREFQENKDAGSTASGMGAAKLAKHGVELVDEDRVALEFLAVSSKEMEKLLVSHHRKAVFPSQEDRIGTEELIVRVRNQVSRREAMLSRSAKALRGVKDAAAQLLETPDTRHGALLWELGRPVEALEDQAVLLVDRLSALSQDSSDRLKHRSVALRPLTRISGTGGATTTRSGGEDPRLVLVGNPDEAKLSSMQNAFKALQKQVTNARYNLDDAPEAGLFRLQLSLVQLRVDISESLGLTSLGLLRVLDAALKAITPASSTPSPHDTALDAANTAPPSTEALPGLRLADITEMSAAEMGIKVSEVVINLQTTPASRLPSSAPQRHASYNSLSGAQSLGHERQSSKTSSKNPPGKEDTYSRSTTHARRRIDYLGFELVVSCSVTFVAHQAMELAELKVDRVLASMNYDKSTVFDKHGRHFRKAWTRAEPAAVTSVSHSLLKPWRGNLTYALDRLPSDPGIVRRTLEGEFQVAMLTLWTSDLSVLHKAMVDLCEVQESLLGASTRTNPDAPTADENVQQNPQPSSEEAECRVGPGALHLNNLEAISVLGMTGAMIVADTPGFAKVLRLVDEVICHPEKYLDLFYHVPVIAAWFDDVVREVASATVHVSRCRGQSMWQTIDQQPEQVQEADLSEEEGGEANDGETQGETLVERQEVKDDGGVTDGNFSANKDLQDRDEMHDLLLVDVRGFQLEVVKEANRNVSKIETFLPVIRFEVNHVRARGESFSVFVEDFMFALRVDLEARFYNRRIGSWEFILEPWRGIKMSAAYQRDMNTTHLDLDSLLRLNVNISEDLVALLLLMNHEVESSIQTVAAQSVTEKGSDQAKALSRTDTDGEIDTVAVTKSRHGIAGSVRSGNSSLNRAQRLKDLDMSQRHDHWIVNNTGVDLVMHDMYQIGCDNLGVVEIEYRDGWDLPGRERWLSQPPLRFTLLPVRAHGKVGHLDVHKGTRGHDENAEVTSAGESSGSGDEDDEFFRADSDTEGNLEDVSPHQDGVIFVLPYRNPSKDVMPQLLIETRDQNGHYQFSVVDLLPYLLFPGTASVEWFQLKGDSDKKGGKRSEVMLSILFKSSNSERIGGSQTGPLNGDSSPHDRKMHRFQRYRVAAGGSAGLSFKGVPNKHWYRTVSRHDINRALTKRKFTTLRSIAIDLSYGLDFKNKASPLLMIIPMNETGEMMLSSDAKADVPAPAVGGDGKRPTVQRPLYEKFERVSDQSNNLFKLNVLGVSAMRDRKRRVLFLESPLVVRNVTEMMVDLLICEQGENSDGGTNGTDVFPSLRTIPLDNAEVESSGNHLASHGMGVRGLFDRRGATKWVDGGHIRDTESRSIEFDADAFNEDAALRGRGFTKDSFVEWRFEKARAICLYTVKPSTTRVTKAMHATPADADKPIDASRLGLDPVSWAFYGRNVSREDIVEPEWVLLDERDDIEFDDQRRTKQFFLQKVDMFNQYRLELSSGEIHQSDASCAPMHAADLGRASMGPSGAFPVAVAGIVLFEEKPAYRKLLAEESMSGKSRDSAQAMQSQKLSHWKCKVCDESNDALFETCGLCGGDKKQVMQRNAKVAKRSGLGARGMGTSNSLSTDDTAIARKHRARLVMERAKRSRAAKRGGEGSPGDVVSRDLSGSFEGVDKGLEGRLRVAPAVATASFRSRDARLSPEGLTLSKPPPKVKKYLRKGAHLRTSSRVVSTASGLADQKDNKPQAARGAHERATSPEEHEQGDHNQLHQQKGTQWIEFNANIEVSVLDFRNNIMLLRDTRVRPSSLVAKEPTVEDRRFRLSLSRGVQIQVDDLETFRLWFDQIELTLSKLKEESRGADLKAKEFNGMKKMLSPGETFLVPINFLYSTKKWSLLMRPARRWDADNMKWSVLMSHMSAQALAFSGDDFVLSDVMCKPTTDEGVPDIRHNDQGEEAQLEDEDEDQGQNDGDVDDEEDDKVGMDEEDDANADVNVGEGLAGGNGGPGSNSAEAAASNKVRKKKGRIRSMAHPGFGFNVTFMKRYLKGLRATAEENVAVSGLLPKVEVLIKPWVTMLNALPFQVVLRIDDSEELMVLEPGRTVSLCEIGDASFLQFRIPALNTAWTDRQKIKLLAIFQERPTAKETRDLKVMGRRKPAGRLESGSPVHFWTKKSKRQKLSELLAEAKLDRSRSPSGPINVVLYCPFWFYNYSDVKLLVRPAKSIVQKDKDVDVLLEPNFQTDLTRKARVLPHLRNLESRGITMAVALPRDELNQSLPPAWPPPSVDDDQDEAMLQEAKNNWSSETSDRELQQFLLSGFCKNVKVAASSGNLVWRSFRFIVNRFTVIRREIGIEVLPGSSNAFTRSVQVIFRTRFLIVNQVPDTRLHFQQTTPALEKQGGYVHDMYVNRMQRARVSTILRHQRSKASDRDGLEQQNEQGSGSAEENAPHRERDSSATGSVVELNGAEGSSSDEEGALHDEVTTGFFVDGALPSTPKDIFLAPDDRRVQPFHFTGFQKAFLKEDSIFRFEEVDSEGHAVTRMSSPLSADKEGTYSVMLRSLDGNGRLALGARHIRTSIRIEGATTFIVFSPDATKGQPFYLVRNSTPFPIEVWQDRLSRVQNNLIVGPEEALAIAWDQPMQGANLRARAVWPIESEPELRAMKPSDVVWEFGRDVNEDPLETYDGAFGTLSAFRAISASGVFAMDTVKQFKNIHLDLEKAGSVFHGQGFSPLVKVEGYIEFSTKTLAFRSIHTERRTLHSSGVRTLSLGRRALSRPLSALPGVLTRNGNSDSEELNPRDLLEIERDSEGTESTQIDAEDAVQDLSGARIVVENEEKTSQPLEPLARAASTHAPVMRENVSDDLGMQPQAEEQTRFHVSVKVMLKAGSLFKRESSYTIVARCGGKSREFKGKIFDTTKTGEFDITTRESNIEVVSFDLKQRPMQVFLLVYLQEGSSDRQTLVRTGVVDLIPQLWTEAHRQWMEVNSVVWASYHRANMDRESQRRRRAEYLLQVHTSDSFKLRADRSSTSHPVEGVSGSTPGSATPAGLGSVPSSVADATLRGSSSISQPVWRPDLGLGSQEQGIDRERQLTLLDAHEIPTIVLVDPSAAKTSVSRVSTDGRLMRRRDRDTPLIEDQVVDTQSEAWVEVYVRDEVREAGHNRRVTEANARDTLESDRTEDMGIRVRLFISSCGVSFVHAAKKLEICYVIAQRIRAALSMEHGTMMSSLIVGNFQVDNHDPAAVHEIIFAPEVLPPVDPSASYPFPRQDFLTFEAITRVNSQPYTEIETFDLSMSRLVFNIEESLLGNFLSMAFEAIQNGPAASEQLVLGVDGNGIQHPRASNAQFIVDMQALSDFVYIYWFRFSDVNIVFQANLDGGKHIKAEDQFSRILKQYVPTLSIQNLDLRFREYSRANGFEPSAEFQRKLTAYVIQEILFNNSTKAISQTNYAINPVPAAKTILTGLLEVFRQPYLGAARDGKGVCKGCQLGLTALIANMASGVTDFVHGLSKVAVVSIRNVASANRYDVVSRPAVITLDAVRSLSYAISYSSTKIANDLLNRGDRLRHVRAPRSFTEQGEMVLYGPGNVPLQQDLALRRAAAALFKRKFQAHLARKAKMAERARLGLAPLAQTVMLEKRAAESRNVFRRWWDSLVEGFSTFTNEFQHARDASGVANNAPPAGSSSSTKRGLQVGALLQIGDDDEDEEEEEEEEGEALLADDNAHADADDELSSEEV